MHSTYPVRPRLECGLKRRKTSPQITSYLRHKSSPFALLLHRALIETTLGTGKLEGTFGLAQL
jgi:hypothetical protein